METTEQGTTEQKVVDAIESIRTGAKSPKESGIGKLFAKLKEEDLEAYLVRLAEYKPVQAADGKKRGSKLRTFTIEDAEEDRIRRDKNRDLAEEVEREVSIIMTMIDMPMEGIDDDEAPKKPSRKSKHQKARLTPSQEAILRDRKAKVKIIPERAETPDQMKFILEGEEYGKGPLVLATIKRYCVKNPGVTFETLKQIFPDSIVKGYGAFAKYDQAMIKSVGRKRYFLNDSQTIQLVDGRIAVCNQITGENVRMLIAAALKAGIVIK